jgi:glycosyltransferase involved in cell wall biosynthesis
MQKIVYIVSTLKKSGPTEVLLNIIKFLDRKKFEPIIITLSPEASISSISQFEQNFSVKIFQLNLSRLRGIFFLKARLSKLLDMINPHCIHSQGFRSDLLVSLFFSNYKFISTIHNNPFADYSYKLGNISGSMIAHLHKYCVKKNPNSFIAVSRSILEIYASKKIKINYIQNGVDDEYFTSIKPSDKNLLKLKLGIPLDRHIFISSGRLEKSKNLITTIEGFNKYNQSNSILLIVGDGSERQSLENFKSEYIHFLGFTDSIVEYYQLADFFISSSVTEGFPMAVLESMAVGLVPILSDIEPHKEIYNGNNLPMFNVMSSSDLADSIQNAIDNKKSYQKTSKIQVRMDYTAQLMSKKYQESYLR